LQTRSPHFFSMQTECHVLLEQIYQLIWWLFGEIEGLSNISCCFGFLYWRNKYMGCEPSAGTYWQFVYVHTWVHYEKLSTKFANEYMIERLHLSTCFTFRTVG
jgi:hypothetical protein